MHHLQIRKVTVSDLDQLQRIGRQTFHETFSPFNTGESMKKYLEESFAADKLTAELHNPESEFYFAFTGDNIIGYLKINSGQAQTELMDDDSIEIERIYVLKEFHRNKVGQFLMDYALQIARQRKASYAWLGVWERNERALSFYRKNGFTEFDKHIFRLGHEEQTDFLMKLEL